MKSQRRHQRYDFTLTRDPAQPVSMNSASFCRIEEPFFAAFQASPSHAVNIPDDCCLSHSSHKVQLNHKTAMWHLECPMTPEHSMSEFLLYFPA